MSVVCSTVFPELLVSKKLLTKDMFGLKVSDEVYDSLMNNLRHEARCLTLLRDCPYVIDPVYVDDDECELFVVHHEHFPAGYLMNRGQQLAQGEWQAIGEQTAINTFAAIVIHDLLAGLDACHLQKLAHLNVTFGNYLFHTRTGGRLVGFGSSSCTDIIEEQAFDIFGAGLLLAGLLIGKHPLGLGIWLNLSDLLSEDVDVEALQDSCRAAFRVTGPLSDMCLAMLDEDPSKRPLAYDTLEIIKQVLLDCAAAFRQADLPVPPAVSRLIEAPATPLVQRTTSTQTQRRCPISQQELNLDQLRLLKEGSIVIYVCLQMSTAQKRTFCRLTRIARQTVLRLVRCWPSCKVRTGKRMCLSP